MRKFIHKILNRKYKKEEVIKQHKEQKLVDVADYRDIRGGTGCGLGR
jgi:hypothetical protein